MDADLVIIGAGPSGIQAAIHASRKKISAVLVGKISNSAAYGAHIENYFGIEGVTPGSILLEHGIGQAASFGCTVIGRNAVSASAEGGFAVTLESGEVISAKAVILATGVSRVKLGIPGETELLGRGVSYCASCDCNFYKGRKVAVVGNESEAAMSAELMTRYASKVYWVADRMDTDRSLVDAAVGAGAEIVRSWPVGIGEGADGVGSLILSGGKILDVDGVFIELGGRSAADLAEGLGIMPEADDSIKTDSACGTSVEGVFACGDITGKPWQVAKAVGEGAVAGLSAVRYLEGLRR